MGRIGCPETSVSYSHYSLRNNPEEHRCQTAVHLLYCIHHIVTMAHFVVGTSKITDSTDNCGSAIIFSNVLKCVVFCRIVVILSVSFNDGVSC